MNINPDHKTETYSIAKTWKRITARIFDIFFVSIIPLVIGLVIYDNNNVQAPIWWTLMIVVIINFLTVVLYFVFIPWKCHGQTLGKLIFQIKLVKANNKNLTFWEVFYREIFLTLIPLLLMTLIILFLQLTFNEKIVNIETNNPLNWWLNILIRTVISFDFAWYCGIMIVTKIDKYHQVFYDRRINIYTINKKAVVLKIDSKPNIINEPHIHLGYSQPGNISDEQLEDINLL